MKNRIIYAGIGIFEKDGKLWLEDDRPTEYVRLCLDCGSKWIDRGENDDMYCDNPDCESENTIIESKL